MNVRIVYLDVSNLLEQTFLTGIQRVVREVAVRLLHAPGQIAAHPAKEVMF